MSFSLPDWEARIPGEQWLMLDSVAAAEAYIATYSPAEVTVCRDEWPNAKGLYARLSFPGRVPQCRIYIPAVAEEF